MTDWCAAQPSVGQYFFISVFSWEWGGAASTDWYFENKEDALLFALKWGNG